MTRFALAPTYHGYRFELGRGPDLDTFVLRVWRPIGKAWWLIYGRGLLRYDIRSVWEQIDIAAICTTIRPAYLSELRAAQHRTFAERAAALSVSAFEVSNVR